MDVTPMVLDRIQRIERRTRSGFELALSVLFTSGIQHYAEIPEGMNKAPDYVQEFLKHVPSVWDDVKFVDGFPGRYVVIARQGEGRWYVAGINAQPTPVEISVPLPVRTRGTLITDGDTGNLSFREQTVEGNTAVVKLKDRGGFVIVFD
jgi:hypothetical protein